MEHIIYTHTLFCRRLLIAINKMFWKCFWESINICTNVQNGLGTYHKIILIWGRCPETDVWGRCLGRRCPRGSFPGVNVWVGDVWWEKSGLEMSRWETSGWKMSGLTMSEEPVSCHVPGSPSRQGSHCDQKNHQSCCRTVSFSQVSEVESCPGHEAWEQWWWVVWVWVWAPEPGPWSLWSQWVWSDLGPAGWSSDPPGQYHADHPGPASPATLGWFSWWWGTGGWTAGTGLVGLP